MLHDATYSLIFLKYSAQHLPFLVMHRKSFSQVSMKTAHLGVLQKCVLLKSKPTSAFSFAFRNMSARRPHLNKCGKESTEAQEMTWEAAALCTCSASLRPDILHYTYCSSVNKFKKKSFFLHQSSPNTTHVILFLLCSKSSMSTHYQLQQVDFLLRSHTHPISCMSIDQISI